MFRQLIPALADRCHVVAPDLPGFGFTETPELEGSATLQIAFLSGS
jgi:pimeloyl-ACP methyl ester carboxylesterase